MNLTSTLVKSGVPRSVLQCDLGKMLLVAAITQILRHECQRQHNLVDVSEDRQTLQSGSEYRGQPRRLSSPLRLSSSSPQKHRWKHRRKELEERESGGGGFSAQAPAFQSSAKPVSPLVRHFEPCQILGSLSHGYT